MQKDSLAVHAFLDNKIKQRCHVPAGITMTLEVHITPYTIISFFYTYTNHIVIILTPIQYIQCQKYLKAGIHHNQNIDCPSIMIQLKMDKNETTHPVFLYF